VAGQLLQALRDERGGFPADELPWHAADESRDTVMTQHRLPQRGDRLRDHELRGLYRIVGMEVVVAAHLAGQFHHVSHSLLRRPGLGGLECRQRVRRQTAERTPPFRSLGVMYPAVAGHVGAGAGKLNERRHLGRDSVRVR
jgi:hypothetical protein